MTPEIVAVGSICTAAYVHEIGTVIVTDASCMNREVDESIETRRRGDEGTRERDYSQLPLLYQEVEKTRTMIYTFIIFRYRNLSLNINYYTPCLVLPEVVLAQTF